ncbi:MAG: 4-(cytidine 5'-diphospho)-2-C-methyl-D-erythritol kinase [Acidimicrobiales bacterium]
MEAVSDIEYASAKLTLSLRLTGVRPDGFHLLDAEMITLELADTLTFSEGDSLTVSDEVAGAGTPLPVTDGEENLVSRAMRAVGRRAAVHLVKRIPAGAGLGGGSADAAAVLRWAGRASGSAADVALAASLGADVPFCVLGGRARVTGIGDELSPLPCLAGDPYTLLTPPLPVPTAAAYRAWDDLGGPTADGPNDLEVAAMVIEPRLGEWRDRLGRATGQTPVLAGSGSTWWVPGAYPHVAGAVVTRSVCPGG